MGNSDISHSLFRLRSHITPFHKKLLLEFERNDVIQLG